MEAELQELVTSEKLSPQAGQKLQNLQPGACCFHRSWGIGIVREWQIEESRLIVDFKTKAGHALEFEFAAQSLKFIPPEHLDARVLKDAEGVKKQALEDPVGLMKSAVSAMGAEATAERIEAALSPAVLPADAYKKWWDGAKRAMRKDGSFEVPAKRTAPIVLMQGEVDRNADAFELFEKANGPKAQTLALEEMSKHWRVEAASKLDSILASIRATIEKTPKSQTVLSLQLVLALDDVLQKAGREPFNDPAILAGLFPENSDRLNDLIEALPASRQPRVITKLVKSYPSRWPDILWNLLPKANGRVGESIIEAFREAGRFDEVLGNLEKLIRERRLSADFLAWLVKNRGNEFKPVLHSQILFAVLTVLEQTIGVVNVKGATRLRELIIGDKTLFKDILGESNDQEVRDFTRAVMLSPAFEELDKRSVLATLVKSYPFVQSMIVGGEQKSEAVSLIVSWESLEKRKKELEEIVNKKIPENSRDISVARSYGDLRENHEFKAAKEMQTVLMRRKAELEAMITNAQGTDFSNVATDKVNIGTKVALKDMASGESLSYTILGAWDSKPEVDIISYMTPVAQALNGKSVGDEAELPLENGGKRRVRVESIQAYR
jgi:transcription elongation GreA/GreB family factor